MPQPLGPCLPKDDGLTFLWFYCARHQKNGGPKNDGHRGCSAPLALRPFEASNRAVQRGVSEGGGGGVRF